VYLQWLRRSYAHATLCLASRGVKQTNVPSLIWSNAGSKQTMRNRKQRLPTHWWHICSTERFANIRYANDVLLCAKSWK
jgi:hypothetical protein